MEAGVEGVAVTDCAIDQQRFDQDFRDHDRVVVQHREQLAQPVRRLAGAGHPVHLGLNLFRADGDTPVLGQQSLLGQVLLNLGPQLCGWQQFGKRRLGGRVLRGPDPVSPVELFNSALVVHALVEAGRIGIRRQRDKQQDQQRSRHPV